MTSTAVRLRLSLWSLLQPTWELFRLSPDFCRGSGKSQNNMGRCLFFDEVITGFRLSYGGAQEYYGVTPDLTTLGKIIGGGMPMAAYCGRKDIMSQVSPTRWGVPGRHAFRKSGCGGCRTCNFEDSESG